MTDSRTGGHAQACRCLHGLAFHSEFAARLQGPLVANLRKCLRGLLGHTDPRRVAAALPILSALAHGCPAAADALVDADLLRAVLRLATAEAHTLPAEGLASPADHNNQMRAEAGQEGVEQEQQGLSANQRGRRPSPGEEGEEGGEEEEGGCQGAALQALGDLAFCPGSRRTLAALDPVPRLEALAAALPATGTGRSPRPVDGRARAFLAGRGARPDGARGRGAAMTSRRMKAVRVLAALGENAVVDRLLGKPDRADRGLRVLAIDGGGMKGLVVCVLLRELERRTGRRYARPRTGRAGPLAEPGNASLVLTMATVAADCTNCLTSSGVPARAATWPAARGSSRCPPCLTAQTRPFRSLTSLPSLHRAVLGGSGGVDLQVHGPQDLRQARPPQPGRRQLRRRRPLLPLH